MGRQLLVLFLNQENGCRIPYTRSNRTGRCRLVHNTFIHSPFVLLYRLFLFYSFLLWISLAYGYQPAVFAHSSIEAIKRSPYLAYLFSPTPETSIISSFFTGALAAISIRVLSLKTMYGGMPSSRAI